MQVALEKQTVFAFILFFIFFFLFFDYVFHLKTEIETVLFCPSIITSKKKGLPLYTLRQEEKHA
jgi:hypothetical protein